MRNVWHRISAFLMWPEIIQESQWVMMATPTDRPVAISPGDQTQALPLGVLSCSSQTLGRTRQEKEKQCRVPASWCFLLISWVTLQAKLPHLTGTIGKLLYLHYDDPLYVSYSPAGCMIHLHVWWLHVYIQISQKSTSQPYHSQDGILTSLPNVQS